MPSAESLIIAHIEAGVTDLSGKISPHLRAQGTALPVATYRVNTQAQSAMNAASAISRVSIDLDVLADTHAEARILADAVAAACDHATVSGIQSLHVESQTSDVATPDDGQGDAERIASLTLVAWTSTIAEED